MVREPERRPRRDSFERSAEDYDAARPGYPAEALAAAAELAGLGPGSRVLEVGCGTGQATGWLAALGCRVLAIDRSAAMLALARRRLGAAAAVALRAADFEALAPERTYDALVFATSYHWLDPADRSERCAGHLRPGGALVLLWHTHPLPYTGFHERVQPIYRRLVPEFQPRVSSGRTEEEIRRIMAEIEAGGRFGPAVRRGFDWTRTYARDDYLRLVSTYSDHRLLPDGTRRALFGAMADLIDREYGGEVERPYRTELVVAKLLSRRSRPGLP